MINVLSKYLAVLAVIASAVKLWPSPKDELSVLFSEAIALCAILFPAQVEEFTFGTWHHGYQVDSHTPPVLIVFAGWVMLGTTMSLLFFPGWLGHALGM